MLSRLLVGGVCKILGQSSAHAATVFGGRALTVGQKNGSGAAGSSGTGSIGCAAGGLQRRSFSAGPEGSESRAGRKS